MRIYIESTIPSYIVARPARDLLQAARQQMTKDWWNSKRHEHELFASQLVLDEIAFGEAAMARLRLDLLRDIPLLQFTEAAKELARKILQSGLLPAKVERDAVHIALACVYQMELLLTWNCRDIANAAILIRLRPMIKSVGYDLPEIYTPEELMGYDNEQID